LLAQGVAPIGSSRRCGHGSGATGIAGRPSPFPGCIESYCDCSALTPVRSLAASQPPRAIDFGVAVLAVAMIASWRSRVE